MEEAKMLVEEQPIVSFRAPAGQAGSCGQAAQQLGPYGHTAHVINVRIASSPGRHVDAAELLRKMYAWRGYAIDIGPDAAANKIMLYAEADGMLLGTMSLCFDRHGELPADAVFRDRLDLLRRQGRRLCEPSRLAIDKGASKRVFAALIHVSYIYAHHLQGYTDYVIEVNPRHVAFYKRMLGFADFGGERACERVGAPAVLLRLPLDYMGTQIRRWGGTMGQGDGERSFYPYFFPVRDEPGITARLLAGCVQGEAA
jgi:hypothetical protein